MERNNVLVLIPARYASTRFPGKPLAYVAGKTMIQRVYDNCIKSGFQVCVVTDNQEIENHVNSFGGKVCRVDDDVSSGTGRIYLAYDRFFREEKIEYVVNVQGDEPLLESDELIKLVDYHIKSKVDIGTMVKKMTNFNEDFRDSNRVKVIFSEMNGRCHYFSRAPIPFTRDNKDNLEEKWFLHIGVYSYTVDALEKFAEHSDAYYETLEKLEQLRALDLGLNIGAVETNKKLIGVDTPEDLHILEGVLLGTIN